MKRLKMSPAMAVSLVALFVALGGTGYAVVSLPKNSVGTKQLVNGAVTTKKIKARAVTGAKIAPNSLTGAQILESRLGKVPRATLADAATSATHADDAATLGGLASGSFLSTGRVAFGTGFATSVSQTVIINMADLGITVTSDGDADVNPDVIVHLPNQYWYFFDENSGLQMFSLPNGGTASLTAQAEVPNVRSSYASALIWQITENRGMYLRCVFDTHGFTTARPIACWAVRV